MTTKGEILKIIRAKCIECCAGSEAEVKNCTSNVTNGLYTACPLYPFRMGKDPKPSKANVERGRKLSKSSNKEQSTEKK